MIDSSFCHTNSTYDMKNNEEIDYQIITNIIIKTIIEYSINTMNLIINKKWEQILMIQDQIIQEETQKKISFQIDRTSNTLDSKKNKMIKNITKYLENIRNIIQLSISRVFLNYNNTLSDNMNYIIKQVTKIIDDKYIYGRYQKPQKNVTQECMMEIKNQLKLRIRLLLDLHMEDIYKYIKNHFITYEAQNNKFILDVIRNEKIAQNEEIAQNEKIVEVHKKNQDITLYVTNKIESIQDHIIFVEEDIINNVKEKYPDIEVKNMISQIYVNSVNEIKNFIKEILETIKMKYIEELKSNKENKRERVDINIKYNDIKMVQNQIIEDILKKITKNIKEEVLYIQKELSEVSSIEQEVSQYMINFPKNMDTIMKNEMKQKSNTMIKNMLEIEKKGIENIKTRHKTMQEKERENMRKIIREEMDKMKH